MSNRLAHLTNIARRFFVLTTIIIFTGAGGAWAAPPAEGTTWLVMIYQDADDQILEQDIFVDFNEMEVVGSTDQVHIVCQFDRFKGAFDGGGDWTSARRYYITQDDDLNTLTSQVIDDLAEVAMSDGDTLVDFITWAVKQYPADKHVLIMSDHGAGWPGGWNDPDPAGKGDDDIFEDVPAPPGEYEIGFVAEDLDGNYYEEYAEVLVTD